jgi:hypothetical protein
MAGGILSVLDDCANLLDFLTRGESEQLRCAKVLKFRAFVQDTSQGTNYRLWLQFEA